MERAVGDGARLLTGGGIPEQLPVGHYPQPTLLADVDPDSEIANNSIYGLSGEVSSDDLDRTFSVATRMRTGNVTINGESHFDIGSPFGGTKQSGLGYRNGAEGYREYLDAKTIGMPD